jgi:hypothetical protein
MVEEFAGVKFNSCLLDEKSLGKDNTIASLSFGTERKFLFKHKRMLNTILYNRKEDKQ